MYLNHLYKLYDNLNLCFHIYLNHCSICLNKWRDQALNADLTGINTKFPCKMSTEMGYAFKSNLESNFRNCKIRG